MLKIFVFLAIVLDGIDCQEICFAPGTCVHSTAVGGKPAQDYNECLEACKDNNPQCFFFSFVPSGDCIFFKNCDGGLTATECPNCLTGGKLVGRR